MAKKAFDPESAAATATKKPTPRKKADLKADAEIAIPIDVNTPAGYASNRCDFQLTKRQAAALKCMWYALSEAGARFQRAGSMHPEGKTVETGAEAMRWLLDRYADELEDKRNVDLVADFDFTFG